MDQGDGRAAGRVPCGLRRCRGQRAAEGGRAPAPDLSGMVRANSLAVSRQMRGTGPVRHRPCEHSERRPVWIPQKPHEHRDGQPRARLSQGLPTGGPGHDGAQAIGRREGAGADIHRPFQADGRARLPGRRPDEDHRLEVDRTRPEPAGAAIRAEHQLSSRSSSLRSTRPPRTGRPMPARTSSE